MMHTDPVLLHCEHSVSPSGTTQRILLSRHDAQAIEARCRTCCLPLDRVDGAGLAECSGAVLSLSPSERDLRFAPAMTAVAATIVIQRGVLNEGDGLEILMRYPWPTGLCMYV